MTLNVRRYDRSCHNKPELGQLIHQCRTCDTKSRYYLCQQCFILGNHSGHKYVSGRFNRTKLVICNCGELHGLLRCGVHHPFQNNGENMPIYTRNQMRKFSRSFGIHTNSVINLSRLNQICVLDQHSDNYTLIKNYFKQSNAHGFNMQIVRIWSVMRKDSEQAFVEMGFDRERRMLLWHGTPIKNLESILLNGLQLPDMSSSENDGLMFGDGIYFADRSSKSAKYTDHNRTGLLLLCEVALGQMWRTGRGQDYINVPHDMDSIKGVGRNIPAGNLSHYDNDIIVPGGCTTIDHAPFIPNTVLHFNEYIVKNPKRILIKFIVQIYVNKRGQ